MATLTVTTQPCYGLPQGVRGAGLTFVTAVGMYASGFPLTATLPYAPQVGDILFLGCGISGNASGAVSAITQSGQTWVRLSRVSPGNNCVLELWYTVVQSAGSGTSVAASGVGNWPEIAVMMFRPANNLLDVVLGTSTTVIPSVPYALSPLSVSGGTARIAFASYKTSSGGGANGAFSAPWMTAYYTSDSAVAFLLAPPGTIYATVQSGTNSTGAGAIWAVG